MDYIKFLDYDDLFDGLGAFFNIFYHDTVITFDTWVENGKYILPNHNYELLICKYNMSLDEIDYMFNMINEHMKVYLLFCS